MRGLASLDRATGGSEIDRGETDLLHSANSYDAIKKAIRITEAERARLQDKMKAAQDAVREIQEALSELNARDEHLKRAAAIGKQREEASVTIPETLGTRHRKRRTSMAYRVRQEVYRILKRVNRPLNRVELLRELQGAGIELPAHDALAAITKIMWNTPEFTSTGGGYWLASEPIPT
ncbi:hypothetical protein FZ934_08275 [Rhizobium grahamii]|uniref:Uncharacterized protein n=1 Tax=Rhizobium grahamii TaxID=1120045 RepID=A0A5Q0C9S5_9HYPH|nr:MULTISPECIES: hypothetical protein [Rhizobium]QFY60429.1 hypothetical protein FZ934_08275 [Rhizobium grahamii]QRM50443.1 hypothetical protein F3Y33_14615 [Rhizobium sp. BG6]